MRLLFAMLLLLVFTPPGTACATTTDIDVRVLARGAKFLGGYTAPVRVTLTDADTGEVLATGQTAGTTGDTAKILGQAGKRSTEGSAVFRASLDLVRPRRVTLSVTGPLSQPQATTTATSTQWVLPGHSLTAGDGWLMELPGLIVDVAQPMAYQSIKTGTTVPLRVGVTMLCGCAITAKGPWRVDGLDVEASLVIDGGVAKDIPLRFDAETGIFASDIPAVSSGLYELEVRAWMGESNNAGMARTTFFVH